MTSANKIVQTFVELCAAKGVRHFVFSPGSRNAPLAIALFGDARFTCKVVPDERSAGFIALGMALELDQTVGVCCTSGSAVLNYAPAVAEAFYQNVPLLVVSADRPEEFIHQGEGQSINQKNVFANHIKTSVHLPKQVVSKDDVWFVERQINEALNAAQHGGKGPVHINFPFAEPLYEVQNKADVSPKLIDHIAVEQVLTDDALTELHKAWQNAPKKLILCGQMPKNERLNYLLEQLSEDKSVAILVENTSNLVHKNFSHCIDRLITTISEKELEKFTPDILVTIGDAIISKKIKAMLRKLPLAEHWDIHPHRAHYDTYQKLTKNIQVKPEYFFKSLLELPKNSKGTFFSTWKTKDYLTQEKHFHYLDACTFSDLKAFSLIADYLPEHSAVHMGNSSVVRYMQLFDPINNITYYSNRGVSGIDGSTSTALGVSLVNDKTNILITGDISFFYDSNALWNKYLHPKFKIILINNGGGGIFRIIDGPNSTDILEEFFESKQDYNVSKLCETFGLSYFYAEGEADLAQSLEAFLLHEDKPALIEIKTPGEQNAQVLKDYFKSLH